MIDSLIEQIIQNPLFLKLKDIVENNGYHDHEDVYSHSVKVKDTAIKELEAGFITNPEAKSAFLQFVNEDFKGYKRADIMILTALVHDVGKMLFIKEGDQMRPIKVTNNEGTTSFPGHEYWGSTIVGEFLRDLSLPKEVVEYIADIIKLHDTFGDTYFAGKIDWPMDTLLNDVKSRAEGLYKEAMFNQYCDCFTAEPYKEAKEMVIKIFNEPALYERREYVLT